MQEVVNSEPTMAASSDQLQDVVDVLRRPIEGKEVLIPFGSKAFFLGKLRPQVQDEERVVLRGTNETDGEEMTRQQALERLKEELESRSSSKSGNMKKTAKPAPAPSIKPSAPKQEKPPSPTPEFFEIREEYDPSGRETTGEAVNVTQHLAYLQQELAGGGGKAPANAVPQKGETSKPSPEATIPVEEEKQKKLTDEEYDALSARLDELARLEENTEKNKSASVSAVRKLQGKGWSKGFLNAKKKPVKPKVPPAAASKTTVEHALSSPGEGEEAANVTEKTSRKVAFGQDDEVREIPRVGQRSVAEVTKPAARPRVQQDSLFGGSVRERSQQPRQQQPKQQPKKKLSRFAMERQQMKE